MVKKILVGVGVLLVILIIAIIVTPMLYKEEIKLAIDEQLEANVNADVLYDIDNFSLSLFSNFPNITAGIEKLGVIGREPFAGEVLFAVEDIEIELNIFKLFGSEMAVQGIYLTKPQIFIKVLEDGSANYDIAISESEEPETESPDESSDFKLAIENWRITDGHIIYDDATIPTYVEFSEFNHQGNGDFTLSVFDMTTSTEARLVNLTYDGDSYLSAKYVNLDLILNMDLDQMKFTFKDNELAVNDFSFGFNGWLAMPADDIDMDLSFNSRKNSFKSLLSLIPAMYAEDFEDLESAGDLAFNGSLKGTYNENSMPAYDVNLLVTDGMFHYPDLPESVSNVQLDMNIASKDGNIDYTSVDISKIHIEFGEEPLDGYLKIGNLITYPIDMELTSVINFANLNHLIPMQGLDLAGILDAHIKVSGEYDSINSTIPKIDAVIGYKNGSVKYSDVPALLSNINVLAIIKNTSGQLNDTEFSIPEFSFELDKSPVSGNLFVNNFDNPKWEAALNGELDFNKLFPVIDKLYPMPGTKLDGVITASLNSTGNLQDLERENYSALSTSGKASFRNFIYSDSVYLSQGFAINSGEASFTPKDIKVVNLDTKAGNSDFLFNGTITNYLNYVFNDDVIRGQLSMESKLLDVNEFMVEPAEDEIEDEESESYSVIEVPKNIDFVFSASLDEIKYDKLVLKSAKGRVIVKDGEVILDNLFTKTLGGAIGFNGLYSTRDMKKPSFDMSLDVKAIEIASAFQSFSTIQALAPVAANATGKTSTLFSLKGILQEDMMPDLATLTGQGKVTLSDASLKNSKLASGLTSYLKGGENQSLSLKDLSMYVKINDGKLQVEPFDLKLNNSKANISGTTSLEGTLDYKIKMDVPVGQLGTKVNSLLGSVTGAEGASETLSLNIGLGGTYSDPKFNLLGSDGKSAVASAAKEKAADVIKEKTGVDVPVTKEELNKEAVAKAKAEADKLLTEAQKQADQVKLEAKRSADKLREEAQTQSDKLMKEAGNNILKKKAAELAGKKLVEEAEVQATRLEQEGNKKADLIMTKAQKSADTLIKNAENK